MIDSGSSPMIAHHKAQANFCIGIGLTLDLGRLLIALLMFSAGHSPSHALATALTIIGWAGRLILICGCALYAMAKGRSPAWGAFGLLSVFGLMPLVLLVDRSAELR